VYVDFWSWTKRKMGKKISSSKTWKWSPKSWKQPFSY